MRFARAMLCAAVLAAPLDAFAFECKLSEDYDYVSLSWDERTIAYAIMSPGSTTLDNSIVVESVQTAFEAWAQPTCTDIKFEYRGVVSEDTEGVNEIVFIPNAWRADPAAVAITRTAYGTGDGIIRRATIEVNEEEFSFVDASLGCGAGYDLNAVLTHEVGHLIGLDHTREFRQSPTDPTMAPVVDQCEMDKRSLEDDDISGLCLLYPVGQPSGRCKPLPLQADPYVANTPFGCSSSGDSDGESLVMLLLGLGFMRGRFARSKKRNQP